MILSAMAGSNADFFPSVLSIYAKPNDRILDMTYGKGVFWSKVDRSVYRLTTNDLVMPADTSLDFRDTKMPDASFEGIIFDPPYAYSPKGTVKASIADCYRLNDSVDISSMKKVLELYESGIAEARRLLVHKGVLIVKCQDIVEGGKQWWMHNKIMELPGFFCEDLMVLVQRSIPTSDPKWKQQLHARKNHSFFVVLRKTLS